MGLTPAVGARAARVKVAVTVTGELPAMTQGSGRGLADRRPSPWSTTRGSNALTAPRLFEALLSPRSGSWIVATGAQGPPSAPVTHRRFSDAPAAPFSYTIWHDRPPASVAALSQQRRTGHRSQNFVRAGSSGGTNAVADEPHRPSVGRVRPRRLARRRIPGPSWLPAFPPSRSSGFSPSSTSPRPGSGCPWRPCTRASPWCGRRRGYRRWPPCCSSATGSGRGSR